ncbi:MAG: YcxB family protein [Pseudomonadota bacterium]
MQSEGPLPASIQASYQLTIKHRQLLGLAEAKFQGGLYRWYGYLFYVLAIGLTLLAALYVYKSNVEEYGPFFAEKRAVSVPIGLAATLIAQSIFCWGYMALQGRGMRGDPVRRVTLTRDGVREDRPGSCSTLEWSAIAGVVPFKGHTFLLHGNGTGNVVPHDALEGGVTPDALARAIETWRAAA